MNKIIGFVLLGVGVLLLIWGISAADSLGSELSEFFTGKPSDEAVWLIVGGVAAIIAGGVMTVMSRRQLKGG